MPQLFFIRHGQTEANVKGISSLVPAIGFTLSTLSLGLVRKIWEKGK